MIYMLAEFKTKNGLPPSDCQPEAGISILLRGNQMACSREKLILEITRPLIASQLGIKESISKSQWAQDFLVKKTAQLRPLPLPRPSRNSSSTSMVIKQCSREANNAKFPLGRDVICSSSRFIGSSRLLLEQSVETTDMIPYEYGQQVIMLAKTPKRKKVKYIVGYIFSNGLFSFQYYHERSSMRLKVSGNITRPTRNHFQGN